MRGTIPHVPGSGIFMIQPKDIDEYGRVNWWQVTETELTGRAEPRWLEPGDVIFRMNGKNNLASYIDRIEVPGLVVCSHQFFHLKVEYSGVAPEYLAWCLNTSVFQDILRERKVEAGTGPVVNKRMLAGIDVTIPLDSDQQRLLELWFAFLAEQRHYQYELAASVDRYKKGVQGIYEV